MNQSTYEKKLPRLSARLQCIADLVRPTAGRVIDVGTDHAYLPIWLSASGICRDAIASDLRSGPAGRAARNIEAYGLADQIKVVISDGLQQIAVQPGDLIIIAGMGGLEIIRILESSVLDGTEIILQPQRSVPELRQWLHSHGYEFVAERLAYDRGHYYVVIKVRYSKKAPKACLETADYWLGPLLTSQLRLTGGSADQVKLLAGYLQSMEKTLQKRCIGSPELQVVLDQARSLQYIIGKGEDND